MKKINIKFAMRYNLKNKSVGHVFQDRFKSQAIENDEYLMQVIRYVHNNPVKAGIINEVHAYKWSSYPLYISGKGIENHDQMAFVLGYFNHQIERFKEFHKGTDYNDYLDIKEDKERHQDIKIELILNEISETYGVRDGYEMINHLEIKEKLIEEMILKSGLSLRKIAKYLEISYNSVQAVNLRMKGE